MELTPKQLSIFSIALKNYFELTDYVGLKREDALKTGAGSWLVDYLKQHQTSIGVIKTMQMTKNPVQNVEAHETEVLPPQPPLGLAPEKSEQ